MQKLKRLVYIAVPAKGSLADANQVCTTNLVGNQIQLKTTAQEARW